MKKSLKKFSFSDFKLVMILNKMILNNKKTSFALLFCIMFSFPSFFWMTIEKENISLNGIPSNAKAHKMEENLTNKQGQENQKIAYLTTKNSAAHRKGKSRMWISSRDLIAHGKKIYKTNCAICHGATGAGDGIAGKSLRPPPRSFIEGEWKQGGDSINLYKSITNGVKGSSMAGFKHLPKKDRWALVHFIRSITKKKIPDNANELASFAKNAE